MGRYYWSKKTESDYLKQVSTSFLRKGGYFMPGTKAGVITWSNRGEPTGNIGICSHIQDEELVFFRYTITDRETGEKVDYDYRIPLTTTSCHFGGKRYWFICPWSVNGKYCGRRVGTLFMGGKHFACRHCHNLTYSSRNQPHTGRYSLLFSVVTYEAKVDKLRDQIKRPYYAGKPTRKLRRLDRLYRRMKPLENVLLSQEMYNK